MRPQPPTKISAQEELLDFFQILGREEFWGSLPAGRMMREIHGRQHEEATFVLAWKDGEKKSRANMKIDVKITKWPPIALPADIGLGAVNKAFLEVLIWILVT